MFFCMACVKLAQEFSIAHGYASYLIGGLDDALLECVREETTINDDDTETLTEAGRRWKSALDAMHERRHSARRV